MSEKPENPLGRCTEEEIEFVNTLRILSPVRYNSLCADVRKYAWQESIAKANPEKDTADMYGITRGKTPFGRRDDE